MSIQKNALSQDEQFPFGGHIESLTFYLASDRDFKQQSSVEVTNTNTFRGNIPVADGLSDLRMGTTDTNMRCRTCRNKKVKCPGHMGLITLNSFIKHPLASLSNNNIIANWLNIVCLRCGNLLFQNNPMTTNPKGIFKALVDKSKSLAHCPFCNEPRGKIVSDKEHGMTLFEEFKDKTKIGSKKNPISNDLIAKIFNSLSPEQVSALTSSTYSHPRNFMISALPVMSVVARPDNRSTLGTNKNLNPLTKELTKVLAFNQNISFTQDTTEDKNEQVQKLELSVYNFIRGSPASKKNDTNTSSIAELLAGKQGRFRGNLLGKRVLLICRSVVVGTTNLKLTEIGIPYKIAEKVLIPVTVRTYNYNEINAIFLSKTYPRCVKLVKGINNKMYDMNFIPDDYILQLGDIVYRQWMDGDPTLFGRQPSLLYSSMSGHTIKVDKDSEAEKMNPANCILYNADFDGDQMTATIPSSVAARAEIFLSSTLQWAVSFQNLGMNPGCFQDTLAIIADMTKYKKPYINRFHAMKLMCTILDQDFTIDDKLKNGYDFTSMLIPENINMVKRSPKFYNEKLLPFLQYYDDKDLEVNIIRGKHISGILDKNTCGQGIRASLFHLINTQYGPQVAYDIIHKFQKLTNIFAIYEGGYTVSTKDIKILEEDERKIKIATQKILNDADQVIRNLNDFKIIPPIGENIKDYFEQLMFNALQPGDDYLSAIFNSIGESFGSNGLFKLIFYGSKGALPNALSINCSLGLQTIGGLRPPTNFGEHRTNIFHQKFDLGPVANGFIKQPYREGLSPQSLIPAAQNGRNGLIRIAMSTSKSGAENRNCVKNLESSIIDHLFRVSSNKVIIQHLYGETGYDLRTLEQCTIPTIMISKSDLEKYNMTSVYPDSKLVSQEFETIKDDRSLFREILMTTTKNNPGRTFMTNKIFLPVNIENMIHDMKFNDLYTNQNAKDNDPDEIIELVNDLCKNMGYMYMNKYKEKNKAHIPTYIQHATTLLKIYTRAQLSTYNIKRLDISTNMLKILIATIREKLKLSLMSPGTCVGVLSGQCVSEPTVQEVIDSKHTVGLGGGFKTDTMERYKEIIGVKPLQSMQNPTMRLAVKPPFCYDKIKVRSITNKIEMMSFGQFVKSDQILIESQFGQPIHPDIKDVDKEVYDEFMFINQNMKIDTDLSPCVIRFEIDHNELNLKSLILGNIILILRTTFKKKAFIMVSSENRDPIIVKFYVKNNVIEKSGADIQRILDALTKLRDEIFSTIVTGIKGIIRTNIISVNEFVENENGELIQESKFFIETLGSNLIEAYKIPEIDPYASYTDSIQDIYEIFGIQKARDAICIELQNTMNQILHTHTSIYADLMTCLGMPTNIEKGGMSARERNNILSRAAFKFPLHVLTEAALNGMTDPISDTSAPLLIGRPPKIGSCYSDFVIDPNFALRKEVDINSNIDIL
jgi:DNA-directed RNA polymerase II subunit RPB1